MEVNSAMTWQEVNQLVIRWRRILHRRPELSHQEFATTRFIQRVLQPMRELHIERVSPTGLIARLSGATPGPVIALRADIDALPLAEASGRPWSSRHAGVMHACGHDAHTAMLLGALHMLYARRKQLAGEVIFIFQAGEEMPPGGAHDLVRSGALNGADCFIALHLDPLLPTGQIRIKPGIATAYRDTFDITVNGRGGHSAMPHQCRDPLVASAALVGAVQTIVAREISPQQAAVISICSLVCGDGTIARLPDFAQLCGTVRCFSLPVKQTIRSAMARICQHIGMAYGCTAEVKFAEWDYQAINNDPGLSQRLITLARKIPGITQVREDTQPASVGEDFSEYQQLAPVCFGWLGVGANSADNAPLHSIHFDPDEEAFLAGVRYYVEAVNELSGSGAI